MLGWLSLGSWLLIAPGPYPGNS